MDINEVLNASSFNCSLSEITSRDLHIFYYSHKMMKETMMGDIDPVNIAQKITIRKNNNFAGSGYEFLIYNLYQSTVPELCNGIRQTIVTKEDNNVIEFDGTGYSSNGVSLSNLCGHFNYKNLLFQYSKGVQGKGFYSKYVNFFADKSDIFVPNKKNVEDFLRETIEYVTTRRSSGSYYWEQMRYIIVTYFLEKGYWKSWNSDIITEFEWTNAGLLSDIDPFEVLQLVEGACDQIYHNINYARRNGDAMKAAALTNALLMYQRVYYYIFYTLL